MMPAAGHLDHMPAHIFQRVGQYEASAEANRKGAAADAAYYGKTPAPDYYPMYTAHNFQFLASSAAMEGRKAETVEAVTKSRAAISDDLLAAMPGIDWYVGRALYRHDTVRPVGRDPRRARAQYTTSLGLTGAFLYAKAVALAAKSRIDDAKMQLAELEKLAAALGPDDGAGLNRLQDVLAVAILTARARVALAEGAENDAIGVLRQAVDKRGPARL